MMKHIRDNDISENFVKKFSHKMMVLFRCGLRNDLPFVWDFIKFRNVGKVAGSL